MPFTTSVWRAKLMPASFGGALFHVETGAMEGGRRIVLHEFPKKEIGYPEDMGRRTRQFSVRGYIVQYMRDVPGVPLYNRDYTQARDLLITQLEAAGTPPNGGPRMLQLPMLAPILVVVPQYRWTEEERYGGYCTFDMTFTEWGTPAQSGPSPASQLSQRATALRDLVVLALDQKGEDPAQFTKLLAFD